MARGRSLLKRVLFGLLTLSQLAACSGADLTDAAAGRDAMTHRTPTVPIIARAYAIPEAPAPLPAEVASVINLTNQDRVANGCPALAPNPILMATAQAHSADMALRHFFAHTSSTGQTPPQRIRAAGYNWVAVAENIAAGYSTGPSVVSTWFNETPPNDPHRANILNCRLHDIGVGYFYLANDPNVIAYHWYWTEDFGTLANA
ncbi:MAG: CAP domain-containing protein [Ktedonobacterales bacterium]